jgi:hypothetical protein
MVGNATAAATSCARDPETEWVPLASLTHWARNPRKNDEAVDGVARSIIAFGWGSPILARAEDRRIIAGHTRAKAAARLAALWRRQSAREREDWHPDAVRTKDTGEVVVRWKAGLTDAQCDALAVADNKLGEKASWDQDLLSQVMASVADAGLVAPVGFSDAELDKMLGDSSAATDLFEVDVSELEPRFTVTVTGPLRQQMAALEVIRENLTEREGVDVFVSTL